MPRRYKPTKTSDLHKPQKFKPIKITICIVVSSSFGVDTQQTQYTYIHIISKGSLFKPATHCLVAGIQYGNHLA